MKKSIIAIVLTGFFFVLSVVVTAQTNSPPENPGGDPEPDVGTNWAMGGSAPIGGGTLILMALGAAYGSKKVYKIIKENHEELES
jgi:hypothetical protein